MPLNYMLRMVTLAISRLYIFFCNLSIFKKCSNSNIKNSQHWKRHRCGWKYWGISILQILARFMLYMNKNATCINVVESHKKNVEKKKSNKNVYIVYYFIFIKFKSRQNWTMVLEVGIVAILRNRVCQEGTGRWLLDTGNIYVLYLSDDYTGMLTSWTPSRLYIYMICIIFCKFTRFQVF